MRGELVYTTWEGPRIEGNPGGQFLFVQKLVPELPHGKFFGNSSLEGLMCLPMRLPRSLTGFELTSICPKFTDPGYIWPMASYMECRTNAVRSLGPLLRRRGPEERRSHRNLGRLVLNRFGSTRAIKRLPNRRRQWFDARYGTVAETTAEYGPVLPAESLARTR